MKKFIVPLALFLCLSSCKYLHIDAFTGSTLVWESGSNNYFNQEKANDLKVPDEILISGEVPSETSVKLKKIPWHSVTTREVVMSGDTAKFLGTFRYDGYALCDLLSSVKIDKKSKENFYPPVDLFIEVWNDKGEYAVFSWGELFYSANMYQVIIAKTVTRVIPGKSKQLWDLPEESKLVVGYDLFSERNISSPTKIIIKSLAGNFIINREPQKFFSDTLLIKSGNEVLAKYSALPSDVPVVTHKTVFYGHGMGYKGVQEFSGVDISKILKQSFSSDKKSLATSMLCVEAVDGYRASFSLSEIINRNDQQEPLLMYGKGGEKGRERFSLYAGCDMFADRAIKGLSCITIFK